MLFQIVNLILICLKLVKSLLLPVLMDLFLSRSLIRELCRTSESNMVCRLVELLQSWKEYNFNKLEKNVSKIYTSLV